MKNFIEIEEACNHLWVTTPELQVILGGVSKSKADKFRKQLKEDLDSENRLALQEVNENKRLKMLANCFYYGDTKPQMMPIKRVLEKAHIDLDYVRREANKMRRAKLIEEGAKNGKENNFEIKALG